MSKSLFIASLVVLAACTPSEAKEAEKRAAASAAAARTAPRERSLAGGTTINATIQDALSSRTNKSGESVRATVSADVSDARGNVVIPAGSTVILTIDKLEASSVQIGPEGRLMLNVTSVTVNGESRSLSGSLGPIAHTMVGRGITTDEAARIAAGTAVGAGVGQVIGKNTKSTVIGGAVGAVAGGAVAVRYAQRDVVVSAGTPVVITLAQSFVVTGQ
jgi:hypothetical protein